MYTVALYCQMSYTRIMFFLLNLLQLATYEGDFSDKAKRGGEGDESATLYMK